MADVTWLTFTTAAGNEVFGNGYYGADWELDNHSSKSPAAYANNVVQYAQAMKAVDPTIKIGAGARGAGIGIAVTETQSNLQAATQPGALLTADAYFTALENGVFNVDYWNTRNGMPEDNITTAPDSATDYGDGGMLSSGNCNSQNVCEPPLNTPFLPYYAFQMLSKPPATRLSATSPRTPPPSRGRRRPAATSTATRCSSSWARTACCSASPPRPPSPRTTWCPGPPTQ